MIINSTNVELTFKGFKKVFDDAFAQAAAHYVDVAMHVPSTTREETYGWLGKFPKLREWMGDRVIQNLAAHGYTIVNRKFESTVAVARDDLADDKVGIYRPIFAELAQHAKEHPDELVFDLLKNGFDQKGFDGQNFFDPDHPVIDENGAEQSVSNMQAGAETPWFLLDTSRAAKPIIWQEREHYELQSMDDPKSENVFMRDEFLYGVRARVNTGYGLWQLAFGSKAALDATNYEAARLAMQSMKGDHGRQLAIKAMTLVVPTSLEGAARRLLKAVLDSGASNEWANSAELIVTPYLD